MKIKLENKDCIDIKATRLGSVDIEYGHVCRTDCDNCFVEDSFENVTFHKFMKLIGVQCLENSSYIIDYLISKKQFIRVKKESNVVTFSLINAYTDDVIIESSNFDDIIDIVFDNLSSLEAKM